MAHNGWSIGTVADFGASAAADHCSIPIFIGIDAR